MRDPVARARLGLLARLEDNALPVALRRRLLALILVLILVLRARRRPARVHRRPGARLARHAALGVALALPRLSCAPAGGLELEHVCSVPVPISVRVVVRLGAGAGGVELLDGALEVVVGHGALAGAAHACAGADAVVGVAAGSLCARASACAMLDMDIGVAGGATAFTYVGLRLASRMGEGGIRNARENEETY